MERDLIIFLIRLIKLKNLKLILKEYKELIFQNGTLYVIHLGNAMNYLNKKLYKQNKISN